MREPLRIAGLAALIVTVSAAPASAHAAFGTFEDLWTGVLHPLTGFRHGLLLLALGLFCAMAGVRAGYAALLAAVPATAIATALAALAGLSLPAALDYAIAVVLSLLCAAALRLPPWATAALGALAGIVMGVAHGAGLDGNPAWFAVGTGLGTAAVLIYLIEMKARMGAPWFAIALRALASWVAAACLIALAVGT